MTGRNARPGETGMARSRSLSDLTESDCGRREIAERLGQQLDASVSRGARFLFGGVSFAHPPEIASARGSHSAPLQSRPLRQSWPAGPLPQRRARPRPRAEGFPAPVEVVLVPAASAHAPAAPLPP